MSDPEAKTRCFGACAVALLFVVSCYPGRSTDPNDYDTVTTVYNKAAPFGSWQTYAEPDSVVHLDTAGQADNISRSNDALILSTVVQQMNSLGYTQVASANAADLIVLVNVAVSTTTGVVSYPVWNYWGWWGGWDGGYGPTWSYYYGNYVVPYSYSTGTLLVTILDNKDRSVATQRLPIVWLGAANGLLTGSNTQSRITSHIGEMFSQSPYLKTQ
jgi:hypothetical protein